MSQTLNLMGLSPEQEIKLMNDHQLLCRKQTLEGLVKVNTMEKRQYAAVIRRLIQEYGYGLSDLDPKF